MFLLIAVLAAACLIGFAAGGHWGGLAEIQIHWWPLAVAALAIQLIPPPANNMLLVGLVSASYGLVGTVVVRNIRTPGFAAVVVGLALNMLVIGANGGMPVSVSAVEASGQPAAAVELRAGNADLKHELSEDARLGFLSDVIPVPAPFRQVVSVGDVVFYLGLMWLVISAMRRRKEPPAVADAVAQPAAELDRAEGATTSES